MFSRVIVFCLLVFFVAALVCPALDLHGIRRLHFGELPLFPVVFFLFSSSLFCFVLFFFFSLNNLFAFCFFTNLFRRLAVHLTPDVLPSSGTWTNDVVGDLQIFHARFYPALLSMHLDVVP